MDSDVHEVAAGAALAPDLGERPGERLDVVVGRSRARAPCDRVPSVEACPAAQRVRKVSSRSIGACRRAASAGEPSLTSCPSDSRSFAVFSSASTQAGSTSTSIGRVGRDSRCEGPSGRRRALPCRGGPAAAPSTGRPGRRPARPRGFAAVSRTDFETTSSAVSPERLSPVKRALGDPLTGGLEADEAVLRGWDADRAAAVVGVRHRHHARGDGCRGATAGAACRMRRVPRVLRRAVRVRLGRRQDAELRHVGLADRDQAGVAEPLGQERVHRRAEVSVLEHLHAQVERLAGEGGSDVLEEERDALEGAVRKRASRCLAALLEELVDDGVQLGIQLLHPRDRGVDELERAGLARADELGLGGCVHTREVSQERTPSQSCIGPGASRRRAPRGARPA